MDECSIASAKDARRLAAKYLKEVNRQKKYNTKNRDTPYGKFVGKAIQALMIRAEAELQIAELYEKEYDEQTERRNKE